jgi:sugar phosphate isomerase/epimerase
MAKEETLDSVKAFGKYIKHCHIAAPTTRCVPLAGDGNENYYKEIFSALSDIGYEGNVSIEASAPNGAESYRESIAYLKMLANKT